MNVNLVSQTVTFHRYLAQLSTLAGIDQVLEELQRHNAEQRELLNALPESEWFRLSMMFMLIVGFSGWRADSNQQHDETINAVRTTASASEQVPYNVQGVS